MGIKDLLETVDGSGDFSVWLGRADGRPVFTRTAEHLHDAASTMKLPVAVALMRAVEAGRLDLDQPVTVHNDFVSANGTDRFGVRLEEDDAPQTWDHLGGQIDLGWLAAEMICGSSNLATDQVLELVGVDASQQVLAEVGTAGSTIRRGIDDVPAHRAGMRNEMSATDLAAVLVAVSNDTIASPESCARVRDLLAANRWNDQIPAGLPDGVRVEHKNGWNTGIRHDGGIVRPDDADPFVLVVCTTSTLPDDDAQRFIADVAAVAWQHRHDLGSVSWVATIETIRCHRVSAPLHTPFVTALRTATTAESLLIEVVDSDGSTGWGEAPQVWQVTGESFADAQACIEGPISTAITGRDARDLTELLRWVQASVAANHGAKAAVDVALHDLTARRLGVTLHGYLGSTATEVRTDVTLSTAHAGHTHEDAERRVAEGFDVLKMKVGTGDAITDVARVKTVRRAIGPDPVIRLDANQGWSARTAVQVIRGIEDAGLGVELVEQPVPAADLDAMAWIRDRVNTPILADESVYGVRDLVEVIRRGAADLVNVKLAKCGGLGNARTMLELARAHGLGTVVGSMMETHVGVGAAAALVAAYPTSSVSDLDAAWWLAKPVVEGGITYEGPTVHLPAGPGLGVTGLIA